jgi:hypothetical protein
MDIWSIFQPFGTFYGHLVQIVVIWYIFPRIGMFYHEKSGEPDAQNSILLPGSSI